MGGWILFSMNNQDTVLPERPKQSNTPKKERKKNKIQSAGLGSYRFFDRPDLARPTYTPHSWTSCLTV